MKIEYFATTNQKGQVVIPKPLRDELSISDSVLLHILKRGNGFYVYPVKEVVGYDNDGSNYLAVLNKTKGAWRDVAPDDKKTKLELTASIKRKSAW